MGCGKDLAEGEEVLVVKEITKVEKTKSLAERINRLLMTEMYKDFWKNPSKRKLRSDRWGIKFS